MIIIYLNIDVEYKKGEIFSWNFVVLRKIWFKTLEGQNILMLDKLKKDAILINKNIWLMRLIVS